MSLPKEARIAFHVFANCMEVVNWIFSWTLYISGGKIVLFVSVLTSENAESGSLGRLDSLRKTVEI